MAKINPNLLPAPEARIEEVRAAVPGQGEFLIYLRQPAFSEFLLIQSAVSAAVDKWCRPNADWYPVVPPVAPSPSLWQAVVTIGHLQCGPNGEELTGDDRYVEVELVPLLGRSPAIFKAVGEVVFRIMEGAMGDLGNDSEAGEEKASAPASNTDTPTPT